MTVGGFASGFLGFLVAAIVLVGLVFAAAFSVAGAQDQTVASMRAHAPRVKRWGGWVLVGVGAWFLLLAAFADFFADIFVV
jgi:protein-S-isoprenylcysteine O-methyltransferase Ste14